MTKTEYDKIIHCLKCASVNLSSIDTGRPDAKGEIVVPLENAIDIINKIQAESDALEGSFIDKIRADVEEEWDGCGIFDYDSSGLAIAMNIIDKYKEEFDLYRLDKKFGISIDETRSDLKVESENKESEQERFAKDLEEAYKRDEERPMTDNFWKIFFLKNIAHSLAGIADELEDRNKEDGNND